MTSADCPLLDPAGRPWPGKGPLRYLDSIFERVIVRVGGRTEEIRLPTAPEPVAVKLPAGGPVELEARVGNLAEARWLTPANSATGGVCLTLTGDLTAKAPLAESVAFQAGGHFGPARVAERLAGPLHLTLQLRAGERAAFGEIVRLTLTATAPP
jgi:hypothetical protein